MDFKGRVDLFSTKPPRLEDAGLEDPALLPDAIQEAFRLAAEKVRSAATEVLGRIDTTSNPSSCIEEGGFTEDQWDDALVDFVEEGQQGSCCTDTRAGGLVEEGHDAVIDFGGHMEDILIGAKESDSKFGEGNCIADGFDADVAGEVSDKNNCPDQDAPGLTVAYVHTV
ncbi:hypothetical protein O6H91_18G026800 [Diphasiastrum complanatum]|uniref:Uncharacterized protein n=1 Tax=Diphasiastrum complanatum TaxID=34168 RepID=A0ACC2AZ47_DIPCM|nr:hypothetical protein O6H91_18G026800 [Diphasiastrum complanatum]